MPTIGERRALKYACEVRGNTLALVRFIWTEDRDEWVRASPKTRFRVGIVERMGTDGILYDDANVTAL